MSLYIKIYEIFVFSCITNPLVRYDRLLKAHNQVLFSMTESVKMSERNDLL